MEGSPDAWVRELNDESVSGKAKLGALVKLANRAYDEPDEIMTLFNGVEEAFDRLLADKEQANKKLGTALGRFHETTLLILLRATRYSLSTAQLLDFLREDMTLALTVLQQLIGCTSYEDAAVACAVGLLGGFCRPETYLGVDLGGGLLVDSVEDGSVQAFAARLEAFSADLQKSKILHTALPAIAQRAFGGASATTAYAAALAPGMSVEAVAALPPLAPAQLACLSGIMRLVCDLALLTHDQARDTSSPAPQHLPASAPQHLPAWAPQHLPLSAPQP